MKKRPVLITIIGILFIIGGILGVISSIPVANLYGTIQHGGLPLKDNNVKIIQIIPNSPAEQAHLQSGDYILSIQGQTITDTNQVIDLAQKYKGQLIKLTIERSGVKQIVPITPRVNAPTGQGNMGISVSNGYKFIPEPISQIVPQIIIKGYAGYELSPTLNSSFSTYDKNYGRLRELMTGILGIIIAYGILRMKKWAIYTFFVLTALGIILRIPYFTNLQNYQILGHLSITMKNMIDEGIALIIDLCICLYFYRNRSKFR